MQLLNYSAIATSTPIAWNNLPTNSTEVSFVFPSGISTNSGTKYYVTLELANTTTASNQLHVAFITNLSAAAGSVGARFYSNN